jgi:predicted small secreted protein
MRSVIVLGLILGLLPLLSGCETVKGVGKDITNAGEAMERAVK